MIKPEQAFERVVVVDVAKHREDIDSAIKGAWRMGAVDKYVLIGECAEIEKYLGMCGDTVEVIQPGSPIPKGAFEVLPSIYYVEQIVRAATGKVYADNELRVLLAKLPEDVRNKINSWGIWDAAAREEVLEAIRQQYN